MYYFSLGIVFFKLHDLFKVVLMVGNYMNAGSKNEQTIGFEMAFLTKVRYVVCCYV